MLWTMQRVFLGKANEKYVGLPEITRLEMFTLAPLAVIIVVLGVYPTLALDLISASLGELLKGL